MGTIADLPGTHKKQLLLISICVFVANAAAAIASNNGVLLDALCASAGAACAAMVPASIAILNAAYPYPCRRKNLAFAFYLSATPVGAAMGGIGSGGLGTAFGWRASFCFLAILYAVLLILAWVVIPQNLGALEERPESASDCNKGELLSTGSRSVGSRASSRRRRSACLRSRTDWFGVFLLIAGVALASIGITIAPDSNGGWSNEWVIATLVAGGLLLVGFVTWENLAENPIILPKLWRNRNALLVGLSVDESLIGRRQCVSC